MTSDNIQVEAKLTPEGQSSFGEQLKAARENMGLSAQEASGRLHLSPRFIHLLENEDLLQSSLPPIYLRGYLRSYARLLNIPEQDLNAMLEKLAPTPAILTSPTVSSGSLALSFPLETNPYYSRLATFFVSFVLLTSVTTWWYMHTTSASPTLIASTEPMAPSQAPEYEQSANNSQPTALGPDSQNSLDLKNLALASTTTAVTAQTQTPPAAVPLPPNQQLALAPKNEGLANNLAPLPAQPAAKPLTKNSTPVEGDENADEQE